MTDEDEILTMLDEAQYEEDLRREAFADWWQRYSADFTTPERLYEAAKLATYLDDATRFPPVSDALSRTRVYVAEHANTPPFVLAWLTRDFSPLVKDAATSNPNTPLTVIAELVKEGNLDMPRTAAIAGRSDLTEELAAQLLRGWSESTRLPLALNPHCPIPTLLTLRADEDAAVSEAAHANRPDEVAAYLREQGWGDETEEVPDEWMALIYDDTLMDD